MDHPNPTPRTEAQHAALQIVLDAGVDFVQMVHAQARAQAAADPTAPLSAAVRDYERAARTIRRTILLQEKLDQPTRRHTAARRQIIRAVEDNIHRHADGDEALHAELLDRLDRPELVEELDDDRPVEAIITDIIRDLGLAAIPGLNDPWQRRTPTDIATLHARAAHHQTPALPSAKATVRPGAKAAAPPPMPPQSHHPP